MDTSSKGSRTRDWLAAAVVAVALAGVGYLIGRGSRPEPPPPPPTEIVRPAPQPVIVPEAVLGRSEMIGIATAAADQFAGGPPEEKSLAGRRFSIRIPFGCEGPVEKIGESGWSYNEESKTLRVRVTPNEWTDEDWVAIPGSEEQPDAVEGFWLPRPWTRSDRCPAASDELAAPEASTVGIAQFFGKDSNRNRQRRGRPLEIVADVDPEELPETGGLQLLLEGRVREIPGNRSNALCHAANVNERPSCLISVEFDHVSVINPKSQEEIANWRL